MPANVQQIRPAERADEEPAPAAADRPYRSSRGPRHKSCSGSSMPRVEVLPDEPVHVSHRVHASRSSANGVLRSSASRLARRAAVAWCKPGLRRPERDIQTLSYLGHGEPDVVVEDEYRSLLERQPAKGSIELVAIVDGQDVGRLCLAVHWQQPNLGPHTACDAWPRRSTRWSGFDAAMVRRHRGREAIGVAARLRSTRPAPHRRPGRCHAGSETQSPCIDRPRFGQGHRRPLDHPALRGLRALVATRLSLETVRPGWADHTRESGACPDRSICAARSAYSTGRAVIGNLEDLALDRHEIAQQTAAHFVVEVGQFDRRELGVAVEVADCDRFAVR